jgi:hypothetical protein
MEPASARALDEAADQVLDGIRTRLRYLVRGGAGLPHPGPPVPHPVRRRGAAHQPDHGAGHLAGEHPVRAGRALHRPASAGHAAHRRRAAAGCAMPATPCWWWSTIPEVMRAADRIIDIGPGPGERGGEIVFNGTPAQILRAARLADRGSTCPGAAASGGPAVEIRMGGSRMEPKATPGHLDHRGASGAQPARDIDVASRWSAGGAHRRLRLRQVHPDAGRALSTPWPSSRATRRIRPAPSRRSRATSTLTTW